MYIHHIALNSTHEGNFVREQRFGIVDYLFLYIKSPCLFIIEDLSYTIKDPTVILISNRTPHKYFSTSSVYIDDYMHFAPETTDDLLGELTFPINTPITISNDMWINRVLQELEHEEANNTKATNAIIRSLVQLLMLRVGQQWDLLQKSEETYPHYDDLIQIREKIFSHPEKQWQIDTLAKEAHLSPSYFQVLYKQAFGSTCISDVISARITAAKELLSSTDNSINDISYQLGYTQVYHFIRQFKKITGLTPGNYRKKTM